MKKIRRKKFFISSFLIVLLIIISVEGKLYMDNNKLKNEMLDVVKSGQVKQVYEKTLKNADSKALTPEGIIRTYHVNYDSVEHNPMGGVMLKLIINDDNKLYLRVTLDKDENGILRNSSGGGSLQLEDMLEKGNTNNS